MQAMKRELHADWTRDFTDMDIAPSLREMSPILLDYVAGFPLRFHRRRIISRECSPLARCSPIARYIQRKSASIRETHSSDAIFDLLSNTSDTNIFTIKIFSRHLTIISFIARMRQYRKMKFQRLLQKCLLCHFTQ